MARSIQKLSDRAVAAAKDKGRISDGGGLYLSVSAGGSKSWVFMWTPRGASRKEMGLGGYPSVSLAKARALAAAYRVDVAEGRDPMAERNQAPEPTFGDAADEFIESIKSEWKNAKHSEQWHHSIEVRCAPIRAKRVSQVETADVIAVLRQKVTIGAKDKRETGEFWLLMPETAGRVRNRIERVLNYCKVKGWREGENPAAWKGHLENLLPKRPKLTRGHQKALPYEALPDFMAKLGAEIGLGARAAEITILTMARSGEVLGMQWPELDLEKRQWICPPERMKMGKAHTVPLGDKAVAILQDLLKNKTSETFVFPGQPWKRQTKERSLSPMVMLMLLRRMGEAEISMHGFRSAARDWAGDCTPFPREVIEHALAHKAGDSVEVAYRRSTALKKRAELMKAWETYCYPPPSNNVVPIGGPLAASA